MARGSKRLDIYVVVWGAYEVELLESRGLLKVAEDGEPAITMPARQRARALRMLCPEQTSGSS